MSDVMAMLHNEMVKRPPLTGPEMRKILAGGRSVAYHGKSGDRFITSPDQIPSVDILVADGYMDPVVAGTELDAKIAELDALRANLEMQRKLKVKTFNQQRMEGMDPYKDDMADLSIDRQEVRDRKSRVERNAKLPARRGRPPRVTPDGVATEPVIGFTEPDPVTT